ncbi:MAG: hypothetical protein B6D62_02255 [Candidatus Cloacimonas sp. 4484_275]|nr:MAG: hypothetical protein B6D62_02255 [Candidatus Cloacimonas sp. 4484_275]
MPRGDGTGPNGMGPMTGRGLGYCAGYGRAGFTNPVGRGFGRGYGFGRGFGRGYGWGFRSPYAYSDISEKTYLENEIRVVNEHLKALEKRLSEIKDEKE